jgi:hypothetical protein
MYPPGSENPLTPGPKPLPTTKIHAAHKSKGEAFEPSEHLKFLKRGFKLLFKVHAPRLYLRWLVRRLPSG